MEANALNKRISNWVVKSVAFQINFSDGYVPLKMRIQALGSRNPHIFTLGAEMWPKWCELSVHYDRLTYFTGRQNLSHRYLNRSITERSC